MKDIIRRILREESRYLRPSQNAEKLIHNQLDKLFSGAEMYHDVVSKQRHDFEFCKNGKNIADVLLFFDENEEVYNDKRPTSERNFTEGTLRMYKETIESFAKFIPVRRNYLKYIIEQWFEDTYMDEIQSKMGRNDLSIDEVYESTSEQDVCVPPITTKPDDVSYEDMVDYIMKGTLFRREDIDRNEEEEPGWVEDLYLKKLRNDEIDRLNDEGILREETYQDDYMEDIEKKMTLVRKFIKSFYPDFNKEGTEVTKFGRPMGTSFSNYVGMNDGEFYAKYDSASRELQLDREVFDLLENFLGEDLMTYVIEWFNQEFGTDAEYVTF